MAAEAHLIFDIYFLFAKRPSELRTVNFSTIWRKISKPRRLLHNLQQNNFDMAMGEGYIMYILSTVPGPNT